MILLILRNAGPRFRSNPVVAEVLNVGALPPNRVEPGRLIRRCPLGVPGRPVHLALCVPVGAGLPSCRFRSGYALLSTLQPGYGMLTGVPCRLHCGELFANVAEWAGPSR